MEYGTIDDIIDLRMISMISPIKYGISDWSIYL